MIPRARAQEALHPSRTLNLGRILAESWDKHQAISQCVYDPPDGFPRGHGAVSCGDSGGLGGVAGDGVYIGDDDGDDDRVALPRCDADRSLVIFLVPLACSAGALGLPFPWPSPRHMERRTAGCEGTCCCVRDSLSKCSCHGFGFLGHTTQTARWKKKKNNTSVAVVPGEQISTMIRMPDCGDPLHGNLRPRLASVSTEHTPKSGLAQKKKNHQRVQQLRWISRASMRRHWTRRDRPSAPFHWVHLIVGGETWGQDRDIHNKAERTTTDHDLTPLTLGPSPIAVPQGYRMAHGPGPPRGAQDSAAGSAPPPASPHLVSRPSTQHSARWQSRWRMADGILVSCRHRPRWARSCWRPSTELPNSTPPPPPPPHPPSSAKTLPRTPCRPTTTLAESTPPSPLTLTTHQS